MPWHLVKRFRFEAAHHLPAHAGKCARVHGHSWIGELEVAGAHLHRTGSHAGMVIDYGDLSEVLRPLVDEVLDHHDLNVTTGLENPTSEELARYVFNWVRPRIPWVHVVAVTIHETCTARCRYASD